MNATTLWVVLLVAGVLTEALGRLRPHRVATLSRASSLVARRVSGRLLLIALWVFVGIHLFVRYTIPH
jgi:hypothetical protein